MTRVGWVTIVFQRRQTIRQRSWSTSATYWKEWRTCLDVCWRTAVAFRVRLRSATFWLLNWPTEQRAATDADCWHSRAPDNTGGGVDHGWLGVLTPWKYVGGVGVCFDPLKASMSHSFIQNCCWITLQVPSREGWKTFVKNGRWN